MKSISSLIAQFASWLIFIMMLLTVTTVVLRYGFHIGSIALQELSNYCHASAFLLAAAFTLRCDEHVRVDIFYSKMNPIQQAWVNALGVLCLMLPFLFFLLYTSWQFFWAAWIIKEGSVEAGGLPFVYLLKFIIPLSTLLLLIEAAQLLITSFKCIVFPNKEGSPS
ncbi:MAG: TRAP transporter small permease subunit [Sinobacterium sp.]|nr:TRAP transporter small permease subunit [Sinobacterium sp.]